MPVVDSAGNIGLACTPLNATNAAAVNGKIAIVDRGVCTFNVKVKNAQDAGALAVIVVDNAVAAPPPGLAGIDPTVVIPSARVSLSDGLALKNALRQAPDCIYIGEIRDRETMTMAISYSLSGHLVVSTLHANNSYHALGRILSFYAPESRPALLSDLSSGLRAIVSQRLVRASAGGRRPAVEVMLNTKLVSELIEQGDFNGVKEAMEKSLAEGSQTFEADLAKLIGEGVITRDEGLAYADSPTNLMWRLQNDMEPVSRLQPKKDDVSDDQPTFTDIQLDVHTDDGRSSGFMPRY
jgi:twitching motility protein PilU